MDAVPFDDEEDDDGEVDDEGKNRKIIEQANLDDSDPLKKIMEERNKIMQANAK